MKENDICVVRRLTGGGAVFHDPGNLNFTFIQSNKAHTLNDFRMYTKPILDVVHGIGIEAVLANIPHEESAIRKAISPFEISDYFGKLMVDELVKGLF